MFGKLGRASTPGADGGQVVGEHPQLCHVAVCHRQLRARRQCGEQVDGLVCLPIGRSVVAREPEQTGEPPMSITHPQAIAAGGVLSEDQPARIDRVTD